jgi:hypothetical protein
MNKLPLLTVLGVVTALSSAFYLGQSSRPFGLIGVKFCPKTANKTSNSQAELDKKYCIYEHKLLKEIWDNQQFQASKPLPDSSFITRDIPAINSVSLWFLISPITMGLAYLAWAKKCEEEEIYFYEILQDFKIKVAVNGENTREEISYKSQLINANWDKQKVKDGMISMAAMQDKLRRQQELQDKAHSSAIRHFDLADSEMDKKIAENFRDKYQAEKESNKARNIDKKSDENNNSNLTNKELINQLIEALKQHEEGWLWTVVDAIKPIWLVGDMGTGKTNTSVAIALIRKYCLDIPVFRIADRHLNGENSEVWNLLEAQSKADNDLAILEAIQDVIERREDRINSKIEEPEQFLLDEFTQLAKLDKESVERFVSSTFSDTRKAKEYFIGVTHNLTNAAFGEGTAEMRKGAFYLQKFTLDNKKPLPRIVVKTGLKDDQGNNLEDVEKTLPGWFRAETIYGHFNRKPIQFGN